jgi:hypothetical protein
MRKLPKVHAKMECFYLNTIAQHGILTPSIPFKKQPFARDHRKEIKLNTCIKEMVEKQVRYGILKGSTKEMCERNDEAYNKTNARISIEHPHSLQ